MADLAPGNRIELEQILCASIRDTLLSVPLIAQYVNVELRERFPETDEKDKEITQKPDLAHPTALAMTSIIQIGMPSVHEEIYLSENQTKLIFTYPITFDLTVKDEWDDPNNTLLYKNSRALFMAVFMSAGAEFKKDVTLGFGNCQHMFLQQDSALTVEVEETGGMNHAADWSLVVHVKGVNI